MGVVYFSLCREGAQNLRKYIFSVAKHWGRKKTVKNFFPNVEMYVSFLQDGEKQEQKNKESGSTCKSQRVHAAYKTMSGCSFFKEKLRKKMQIFGGNYGGRIRWNVHIAPAHAHCILKVACDGERG